MTLAEAGWPLPSRVSRNTPPLEAITNKYDISGEVYVGPTLLPSALPADTTPRGLLVRGPGDTTEKIMTGASQTFGYKLERSTFNQMNEPFLITKPGQQKIVYPEIPLWGKYRVYNAPREAVDSIPQEILHQQCTRMALVASNRHLRRPVEPDREACQPEAALYWEVSDTCPFYHLEWDTGGEGVVMGITSKIPHNGPRGSYITAAIGGAYGTQHVVIASVQESRERKGRLTAKQPIAITPGNLVVGGPGFEQRWLRARRDTGREGLEDEVAPNDDHDD